MDAWLIRGFFTMAAVMLVAIFGFDCGVFTAWLLGGLANLVLDLCFLAVWIARGCRVT